MCLGIPGKVLEIFERDAMQMGKVEFGGITKVICLAYLPDTKVGDYVLVHVGFAISCIDEQEAAEIFDTIRQIGELDDLQETDALAGGMPATADSVPAAGDGEEQQP